MAALLMLHTVLLMVFTVTVNTLGNTGDLISEQAPSCLQP